jgi:hypothetical protein
LSGEKVYFTAAFPGYTLETLAEEIATRGALVVSDVNEATLYVSGQLLTLPGWHVAERKGIPRLRWLEFVERYGLERVALDVAVVKLGDQPIYDYSQVLDRPEFMAAASRVPLLSRADLRPEVTALDGIDDYYHLRLGAENGSALPQLIWDIADFMSAIGNVSRVVFDSQIAPAFAKLSEAEQTLAVAVGGAATYVFGGDWSSMGNEVDIEGETRTGQAYDEVGRVAVETILRLAAAAGVPARLEVG